ncbi:MAG: molybdenum cofactor guanylyltransferase [Chloroflexota bacterium]
MKPTLVINAGGESQRMGQSKALLPVPPDGRPLIAYIAQRLQSLSPQGIVVVANDPEIVARARLPGVVDFIPDRYPGLGPLGGIATALHACKGWAILVACDMPFVNPALFEMLSMIAIAGSTIDKSEKSSGESSGNREERCADEEWDAVVPYVDGYAQTLHALYHRRCLPAIETRLAAKELKVTSFFRGVRVRQVTEAEIASIDPTFRSFINTNTPDDWEQALAMIKS